jgi:translation initiation factor 3 subunit K
VKALTAFPGPEFSLSLHLLPPHILNPTSTASLLPAAGDAPLPEAVQKLMTLNDLLSEANYKGFWSTLRSDDLYADLTADIVGFEEIMRIQIAITVGKCCREVERGVLEEWLQLRGADFEKFVLDIVGWKLEGSRGPAGGMVVIPATKDNEAKGMVIRENVHFDRKSS